MGGHWESKLGADEILSKARQAQTRRAQVEDIAPEQHARMLHTETESYYILSERLYASILYSCTDMKILADMIINIKMALLVYFQHLQYRNVLYNYAFLDNLLL